MKKTTRMKALMLSLAMTAMLLPMTSFAQQTSDGFFRVDDAFNGNRDVMAINLTGNIANDDFDAPLGSGLLILTAAGAGYAISRRKRSFRKCSALVLAALMLLGMTACKKKVAEPITPATGNQVAITLNVGGGAKAEVDPPHVNFVENDKILVAHDGKYVGTLTYTEYETGKFHFQGNIDATVATPRQKLYFYFLGNKQNDASLEAGTTTSCTVNISDQSSELPVLSFSESNENYTGEGSYTASLHNQCALVKLTLENPAGSIQVGGMHTEATISFETPSITPTVTTGSVRLYSKSNTEKWAILLPQAAVSGASVTVGGQALTVDVPEITVNAYITSIPHIANSAVSYGNLSQLTADYEAQDGDILYGTLAGNYKITIAPGATVTLNGVTISGTNNSSYNWAGLNCLGDATIILKDGSTNNVKGFYEDYPGIHVPAGNTLTIKGETLGTGSLNASSNTDETASGAGIGGGWNLACGNIEIQSGVITANGSVSAAGIGSNNKACGTITISGGTVTATGGSNAAGIGSGCDGSCGIITISGGTVASTGGNSGAGIGTGVRGRCDDGITIANTVTKVTATKGDGSTCSIGAGYNGSCGTVTIGGVTGAITESPYTYPVPILDLSTVNANTTVTDGWTITGTLDVEHYPVKISIAAGATVTLSNATINGTKDDAYKWAGLTCLGNATIILKDDSENNVKGFYEFYPGVFVPSGSTLTIQGETEGTGKLIASSNGMGAGIGAISSGESCGNIIISGGTVTAMGGISAAGIGSCTGASCGDITISGGTVTATGGADGAGIGSGWGSSCHNISITGGTVTAMGGADGAGIGSGINGSCNGISITGGTVTATGGYTAAGIGSGFGSSTSCGAITINGGTVDATGGELAAGIGSGRNGSCLDITIANTVTSVTATKGSNAPNSIGAGSDGSCGTVTIGGTVTGNITTSPYTYQP